MSLQFYHMMNVFIISRLVFLFKDFHLQRVSLEIQTNSGNAPEKLSVLTWKCKTVLKKPIIDKSQSKKRGTKRFVWLLKVYPYLF